MKDDRGVFIVLEGADGSGKTTQFKLLSERLKAVGYDVAIFDFPRYDEPSSHFVRKYLNKEYGDAADISPYTASLFFALDRYESAPDIRKALEQGKIVLSNRYVGSNMAHQGGKFTNSGEQRGFFIWEDGLEFQMLGIPRPTMNIFLRVPAEVSYELIAKKTKRSYTDQTHDQHEGDINYLKRSVATYDTLCKLFPKDFKEIDCAPDGKLLGIPEINDKIWQAIKPILPEKPPHKGREVVFKLDEPEKIGTPKPEVVEPAKVQALPDGSNKQRGGDLEITVKKVSLLAANHVQNLVGIKSEIVFEQWPYDDTHNFYTPAGLDKKLNGLYKQTFAELADLHKRIKSAKNMERDLASLIPQATLATLKITGSEGSFVKLISTLRRSPIAEIKWLAEQIRTMANAQKPDKFNESSQRDILAQIADPLSKIASKNLRTEHFDAAEAVTLQNVWPRNEFALLADALFPYITSSRSEIEDELENWSYNQKKDALRAALETDNPILEEARYRWDVITDNNEFRSLRDSLAVSELLSQPGSIKYGYDVPAAIEDAGLDELYIECFEKSAKLFAALMAEHPSLAGYSLLQGHKNRWQFTTTAQNLKDAKPNKNRLLGLMVEKVTERHALVGNFISKTADKIKLKHVATSAHKPKGSSRIPLPRRRRSRKPKS